METTSSIKLDITPAQYFREKIQTAQNKINTKIDEDLTLYLSNLLVEYINPPKLICSNKDSTTSVLDQSLFEIFKAALESPPEERYALLKQLADTSLYISGFFQDYFNRKLFDIGYYILMGQNAYHLISGLAPSLGKPPQLSQRYKNLCMSFQVCVDLVAYVSETPESMKNVDILEVYQRWSKSNSYRLYKILEESGITPIPINHKACS